MNKAKTIEKSEMKASTLPKKEVIGRVVSTKMAKTVVVSVIHEIQHPLYKKTLHKTRKFVAHNTLEGIAVGDMVRIVESKPISKRTHFIVVGKI